MRHVALNPPPPEEIIDPGFADAADRRAAALKRLVRPSTIHEPALGGIAGTFVVDDTRQSIGAFKIRGACAAVAAVADAAAGGVVAASSGSFGMAVAEAAADRGLDALIAMPSDTPSYKQRKIERMGAAVDAGWATYEAARAAAQRIAANGGRVFIDGVSRAVFEGNASLAREVISSGRLTRSGSAMVMPLGIGSLAAPIALYLAERGYDSDLFVAEPLSHCKYLAAHGGGRHPTGAPTLADGAAVAEVPPLSLAVLDRAVRGVIACEEDEIARGIQGLWREHAVCAEGAGALAMAARLAHPELFRSYEQVWLFATGANITDSAFEAIVGASRAAAATG